MNQNFVSDHLQGLALKPQSIAAAGTANGARIVSPGKLGRSLAFILMAGSLTSVTVLTVKVQNSPDNGTTWNDVLQSDGTTHMQFTAAKTIAAAALDQGYLVGSLDVQRALAGDYRLAVTVVTGATVILAAAYVISNLHRHPGQDMTVDDLLAKQLVALQ